MKISKKKQQEINRIDFIEEVLKRNYDYPDFINDPPDMWSKEEAKIFDMLAEMQHLVKEKTIEIITKNKNNE